jgi:hypothetical protein
MIAVIATTTILTNAARKFVKPTNNCQLELALQTTANPTSKVQLQISRAEAPATTSLRNCIFTTPA